METIGITGGIGAGKSTVLDILKNEYKAVIVQADLVGHQVMEPDGPCYGDVISLFGKNIIKEDKTIDRKAISDVVFHEEDKLRQLNAIIHPAVKKAILEKKDREEAKGTALYVVEAALLLQDHYEVFCDQVWTVHADTQTRISRLMESRGYSREKAESIIAAQPPSSFYMSKADFVILNDLDLEFTRNQIRERLK